MIFGDKNTFAIDADLTQRGFHACINYNFWIRNKSVGDKSITSLLTVELNFITNVLDKKGKRHCDTICASPVDLTDHLINKIWSSDNSSSSSHNINIANNILKNLDIGSNYSESFTRFYLFMIECDGYDWLLLKDDCSNEYNDIKIPKNSFYQTFEKLKKWINNSASLALNAYIKNDITLL